MPIERMLVKNSQYSGMYQGQNESETSRFTCKNCRKLVQKQDKAAFRLQGM